MTTTFLQGDCRQVLQTLPDRHFYCCVTSPPYFGLRSYNGGEAEIGQEATPDCLGWATGAPCGECYVCHLVAVFREVRRVLRDDGTCWVNLGDSFANDGKWGGATGGKHAAGLHGEPVGRAKRQTGMKPKDLMMMPSRVALALQADGWTLRCDIVWAKNNPMPESVTDRPTKSHEYIYLLSKSAAYYYDSAAIKEPASGLRTGGFSSAYHAARQEVISGGTPADVRGQSWETRNKRSVWSVNSAPTKDAHFATFPPGLITPCVLAGCPTGGAVLDPFGGSFTTAAVSAEYGRDCTCIELNAAYHEIGKRRMARVQRRMTFEEAA